MVTMFDDSPTWLEYFQSIYVIILFGVPLAIFWAIMTIIIVISFTPVITFEKVSDFFRKTATSKEN